MSCEICDDTGWKPIEEDGVRRVVRCDCWRLGRNSKSLENAGIEPRYKKCSLDNFRTDTESQLDAVRRCRTFIDQYPVVEKGLLFMGIPGVGKTHLATAVLRLAIEKTGAYGLFVDVRKLLRTIKDTYNPVVKTTEFEVIRPVMEAQLLVMDDLGAEKTSEWVDETMNLIINTRYNKRLTTIFTTNYLEREPDDKSVAEVLIERVGFRIHSRLFEMCEFIELRAFDHRKIGDDVSPETLDRLEKHGRKSTTNGLPARGKSVRAQLRRETGFLDLKWPGGKAGS
jgi:DNA replication protein DnaC